ncbi:hypothetical protein [Trinickia terrae]|uniref:hypothetical protein n=1 Tax=Trinickia terrae TaxID=2571161 RepID=UPI001980BA12|nr:hypothetical protein [Trinickia terrae]
MRNKIALEEHFAIDLTIDQSKGYAPPHVWEMLKSNLLDIEQQRLERMEQGGVEYSIQPKRMTSLPSGPTRARSAKPIA